MKSNDCRCLNLIGQKFNKLTVIDRDEDCILPNGAHMTKWLCNCDCGTKNVSVLGTRLKNGTTKSCGCLNKEVSCKNLMLTNHNRKYNKYDLTSYEYGIGWTSNTNDEFYFDLEDYDKIKDYCWYKDTGGYICTIRNQKCIKFHRIIMQDYLKNNNSVVDHIDTLHKEDNRKSNLRVVTKEQNAINRKKNINNKSGKTGVSYLRGKWQANINYQNKRYYLGVYDNLEDAIQARIEAEIKYFGEYRNINEYNGDDK